MKIDVFDDLFSIGHLILGAVTYFIPLIAWIFIVYEIIEFHIKKVRKEETVKEFLGDLYEFMFGIAITHLIISYIM